MVPYADTVVVCVVKGRGGGGEGGTSNKRGDLKLFYSSVSRGMTHSVVPSTHTKVVCVLKGWRGKPLITIGFLNLFSSNSSSYHKEIGPHSGSVSPHSGFLYCERGGGIP